MKRIMPFLTLVALCSGLGCSGGDGGSGPAPGPPKITGGPTVSGISPRAATIEWSTDKESNSMVKYGETTAYTDSVRAAGLRLDHSIALSDLDPASLYHFRVVSDDADGRRVTSSDRTFSTQSPVGELIAQGWDFFEQEKFYLALTRFEDAYSYEPMNIGVLEGLGWTLLRLYRLEGGGPGNLAAEWALDTAVQIEPSRVDCLVALAFVYQAIEAYGEAIEAADNAIALGGEDYSFGHDESVTTSDIRYCLILSLAATGEFFEALEEARVLDPTIELDPDDAATWGGRSSFEEAMLMLIESLRARV